MVKIEETIYDDLACDGCGSRAYRIKKLSSASSELFSFEAWCCTCDKRLSLSLRVDVKQTVSCTELTGQSEFLRLNSSLTMTGDSVALCPAMSEAVTVTHRHKND